ncbi:CDP-alcohol phosphatidyltransferase family protein [Microbulbifer hainanensis]|uniref:CDP-alcohol phosphatidyltransferase family protein n=1 Tax=Microbulbifer hainanensis TaxID=2735675 RepID=UPI0018660CC2|nr:CDP-alcohol phosphatidyltransferase family protein [Microbulbifer hainanensis]
MPEQKQPEPPSRWRHLPNVLSGLRIASIPLIIWLALKHDSMPALIVFLAAALTDALDGFVARRYHWETHFGALLDAIADKLFVLCLMPLLWYYGGVVTVYSVLVIMRYSLDLSVLPILVAWLKRRFKVALRPARRLAIGVAFLVLGLGFLQQVAIEWVPNYTLRGNVIDNLITVASSAGCLLEAWILVTFVPRYWRVARGKQDTLD